MCQHRRSWHYIRQAGLPQNSMHLFLQFTARLSFHRPGSFRYTHPTRAVCRRIPTFLHRRLGKLVFRDGFQLTLSNPHRLRNLQIGMIVGFRQLLLKTSLLSASKPTAGHKCEGPCTVSNHSRSLDHISTKRNKPGVLESWKTSKKRHSGSDEQPAQVGRRAARNASAFSGATWMVTWRDSCGVAVAVAMVRL
jgi:hypothetical protein